MIVRRNNRKLHQSGFTLSELLIMIAIIGFLMAAAVPSFKYLFDKSRMKSAAESIHSDVVLARSSAVKSGAPAYFVLNVNGVDGGWCYAITDVGACDCFSGGVCTLNGVDKAVTHLGLPGVSLTTTLPSGLIEFDSRRGMPSESGSITVHSPTLSKNVSVEISPIGRIRSCSDDGMGYSPC